MSIKDSWRAVGKDFGNLGKDLGKALARSVKKGADAVEDWAEEKQEGVSGEQPEEKTTE